MLNIILSGANGRMGRVITDIVANKENVQIVAGFDTYTKKLADFPVYADPFEFNSLANVIIDFSNPDATERLLEYATQTKTPVVMSTTGHSESQLKAIEKASEVIPVFKSGNMSVGINLMIELLAKCAKVLGEDYDVEVIERHHNQKLDAPSGTAIMLADAVKDNVNYDAQYVYDRSSVRQKRGKNEIGMHSIRGGTIVGEHEVVFAGRDEIISLSHSAASREVFASGAVDAAIFLANAEKAGMYSMSDMLKEKLL